MKKDGGIAINHFFVFLNYIVKLKSKIMKDIQVEKESVKTRYSDQELQEFEKLILKKIDINKKTISILKGASGNGNSGDEYDPSSVKNYEEVPTQVSKEMNTQEVARIDQHLKNLYSALSRVHNKTFSNDSLLLKSADVISNVSETLSDYEKEGEIVFERFHVGKEKIMYIRYYQ